VRLNGRVARLRSSAPARGLPRPREWNATCEKPSCADRGSQVPGAATHRRGQRNRHRLVPASSGAKASLACEDRTLVGCARASCQVAEVGERCRGSKKRASRWQRGRVHESRAGADPRGFLPAKGVDDRSPRRPSRVTGPGRSRALERASWGEVLDRWKALRIVLAPHRSRGRGTDDLGGSHGCVVARAPSHTRERRQGCQRLGPHAPPREDNARSGGQVENVRPAEANRAVVKQAISPVTPARKRRTAPGTDEVRVLVRRRETADIGPTHRARVSVRGAARPIDGAALAEELSAMRADARGGGSEVRTVRAGARSSHRPGGRRAWPDGGDPARRATR
jgi:hypothetical protein